MLKSINRQNTWFPSISSCLRAQRPINNLENVHPRWRDCKVACKGELFFFTPPKRVTSPTWGPPLPCKQALRLSKEQPCICITLFLYISLPSLYDYDVKLPNFTFCRGRECKTMAFCFAELRYSLSEFNS